MITDINTDNINILIRSIDRSMCINNYTDYSVVDKVKKVYRYIQYTSNKRTIVEKWAPLLNIFDTNILENISVKRAIESQLIKKFPIWVKT